jgi:hypothetical protein
MEGCSENVASPRMTRFSESKLGRARGVSAIAGDFGFVRSSFLAKLATVLLSIGRYAQTWHVGTLLCFLGLHTSPISPQRMRLRFKPSMPAHENSCSGFENRERMPQDVEAYTRSGVRRTFGEGTLCLLVRNYPKATARPGRYCYGLHTTPTG